MFQSARFAIRAAIIATALTSIWGCGTANNAIPVKPTVHDATLRHFALPPPPNLRSLNIAVMPRAYFLSSAKPAPAFGLRSLRKPSVHGNVSPLSTSTGMDLAGTMFNDLANWSSVMAGHSASPFTSPDQGMIAPGLSSTNSCLEAGTAYTPIGALFFVFDGCGGGFITTAPIDQTFLDTYTLPSDSGLPEYALFVGLSDGVWMALLFNVQTSMFDLVGSATGIDPHPAGVVLQTFFAPGVPCPPIVTIEASQISGIDNATGNPVLADPSNSTSFLQDGGCLSGDPPTYNFVNTIPNSTWNLFFVSP